MIIDREGIGITTDNNEAYIHLLEGVLSSVDVNASLSIIKTKHDWKFRVVPSHPEYIERIIHEITTMNNLFSIRVSFSKSMKSGSTVTFSIPLTGT